jgi:hypothetical protein
MKNDVDCIVEAYAHVVQMQPDVVDHSNEDHGCDAKEMAASQIESIMQNAKSVYQAIQIVDHLEPWVAEKITLANDYINTIQEWLMHQAQKQECGVCQTK